MFYHGTRAYLRPGELVSPGYPAAADTGDADGLVFFASDPNTADEWMWLRYDGEPYHIYVVEPLGPYEPDRGVAKRDVRPGNFQSRTPLLVVKEYVWNSSS